jgi:hypothetical protein
MHNVYSRVFINKARCLDVWCVKQWVRSRGDNMLGPLAKEKLIIFYFLFLIKEAFIKTSEVMHRVDTKPKRATFGLCLT